MGDRVQRIHLTVAVPGVLACATLALLGRAARLGERGVTSRQAAGARLRGCALANQRLDLPRSRLAEPADDQRRHTRDVRRGHRGALQVAVRRATIDDLPRTGNVRGPGDNTRPFTAWAVFPKRESPPGATTS